MIQQSPSPAVAAGEGRDADGWTALHHAVHGGALDALRLLIAHGADGRSVPLPCVPSRGARWVSGRMRAADRSRRGSERVHRRRVYSGNSCRTIPGRRTICSASRPGDRQDSTSGPRRRTEATQSRYESKAGGITPNATRRGARISPTAPGRLRSSSGGSRSSMPRRSTAKASTTLPTASGSA